MKQKKIDIDIVYFTTRSSGLSVLDQGKNCVLGARKGKKITRSRKKKGA